MISNLEFKNERQLIYTRIDFATSWKLIGLNKALVVDSRFLLVDPNLRKLLQQPQFGQRFRSIV